MWLRMQVRFHADDNEPLARDLARFPQGQRRVGRLLTLASYGLVYLAQAGRNPPSARPRLAAVPTPGAPAAGGQYACKLTPGEIAEVFGDSLEDVR